MRDHQQELNIQIILVSFGTPEQARRWQEATQFPFPLLLDLDRSAYRAFGLASSVLASWHPRVFLYYLRLLLKGRKLMPLQSDPHQLGGDFLIDHTGAILFAQPSKEPTDRPTVQKLAQTIRSLSERSGSGP